MILLSPWCLLGLLVVVVGALLALVRPRRRERVVGSLRLWEEALGSLRPGQRHQRRISPAWVCLLIGALLGVLASAGPVYYRETPSRRVAVVLHPGAEVSTVRAWQELRNCAVGLLSRLSPDDRVRVLLPVESRSIDEWLAPGEAMEFIGNVESLPIPAGDLTLLPTPPQAQHVYHFAPASLEIAEGPHTSVVRVASELPPLTVERIGGLARDDGALEVFFAVRNRTGEEWLGSVGLEGFDATGKRIWEGSTEVARIAPGQEGSWILRGSGEASVVGALAIAPGPRDQAVGCSAYLVRRPRAACKVALVGRDQPLLRRYVDSDPYLELVPDAGDADLLLVNRIAPPPGKPAIVIAPPSPPIGWRLGSTHNDIVLDRAGTAGDHPILQAVNLDEVAVRRLETWLSNQTPSPGQTVVGTIQGETFLLETGPPAQEYRQVYLSFPIEPEVTNFATTDAFVVLLANAARRLSPDRKGQDLWEYATPRQAGRDDGRTLLIPAVHYPERVSGGYPWPGLWRGEGGALEAVNLPSLGEGKVQARPADVTAAVPLPDPRRRREGWRLWPGLLLAAVVLWLTGWTVRDRRPAVPARRENVRAA
jgi:Aerotolerance regulator N-terminal